MQETEGLTYWEEAEKPLSATPLCPAPGRDKISDLDLLRAIHSQSLSTLPC